jgi:hypothetical protein
MKILFAAVLVVVVAGTGCVVVPARAVHRSEASAKNCPPGHQWSDGRCHATGKGHDPAKHGK